MHVFIFSINVAESDKKSVKSLLDSHYFSTVNMRIVK